MKGIIELQRKTAELTDDIRDILHASNINFQALIVEADRHSSTLASQFQYLYRLLGSLQHLIDERPNLYMGYLITKQIQEEEQRVRRQRLCDYEEKIFDQRRIISDKQSFFESLLRPKKKKLAGQSNQQFAQSRARQREVEEKIKTELLFKELTDLQALKRMIEEQQKIGCFKMKKMEERDKTCSISIVNSTNITNLTEGEFPTEKIMPLDEKSYRETNQHFRTNSLQHSIVREPLSPKLGEQQNKQEEENNLATLAGEIKDFKRQNEQLHKIYSQQSHVLKFKKGKTKKLLQEYKQISKYLSEKMQVLQQAKAQQSWRYERCNKPVILKKRASSNDKK